MSAYTTGEGWKPAFEIDLETASPAAFQEIRDRFAEWSKTAYPAGPFALNSGWHDVTPQVAEDLLRRNKANRKLSLATVKKYFRAMKSGHWMPTGQGFLVNQAGDLDDGQHRAWAAYLGKVTFKSFIVADVPVIKQMFAYIDDGKPRSASDALYTSGSNGLSATIAQTIKLASRFDAGALTVMVKQPRVQELTIPEVLDYAEKNPGLGEAAHTLVSTFNKAANVIADKAVASLFLWKAAEAHGMGVIHPFLISVGTGANLSGDSPILAFRERLREANIDDEDMPKERRLALLIKAFNMHLAGKKVGQRGLYVRDNEKFPQIGSLPMAEAAE